MIFIHLSNFRSMKSKLLNPLSSLLSLIIGASVTMVLEETEEVQWIHTVLVVLTTCLVIDMEAEFEGKLLRIMKKIVALILGLGLGILGGIVVRALSWSSPRWSILLVRLVFMSVYLGISVLLIQGSSKLFSTNILFQGKWRIEPIHMALVCFASALPLFSPSSSLALSRCVGVLFASAIVLAVNSVFYLFTNSQSRNAGRKVVSQHASLIETVLALSRTAISANESDKDMFDNLACKLRIELDQLENAVALSPWQRIFSTNRASPSRKIVNLISSHVRTLSYECNSLFWSTMSVATTPFICPSADLADFESSLISVASDNRPPTTAFTNNMASFNRYFGPSIGRILSGLEDLTTTLVELPQASTDDVRAEIVDRITSLVVGYQLVEGVQGMEFLFKQVGGHHEVFASNGQRWNMCAYLVNLGTVVVSVIDLARTVITSYGLPEDIHDRAIVNLSDYSQRISSLQKMGSLNDLLDGRPVSPIQPVDVHDDHSVVID